MSIEITPPPWSGLTPLQTLERARLDLAERILTTREANPSHPELPALEAAWAEVNQARATLKAVTAPR